MRLDGGMKSLSLVRRFRWTRSIGRHSLYALLVAVGLGAFSTDAHAQRRFKPTRADEVKFDDLLKDVAGDNADVPVIVEFNDESGADKLVSDHGGRSGKRLGGMRGRTTRMNKRMLRRLAASGKVRRVHYDRPVETLLGRLSAATGALAVQRRLGFTGAGVGVAVIDSGVTPSHDDLRNSTRTAQRITKFVDFVGGQAAAYDDWGHGTHVAGIIAGNGYDAHGARTGMAPDANLVVLKALDGNGQGRISTIIAALDWAVANRLAYNIRVINMSLGAGVFESYKTDPLTLAAKRAVDAGIVVVAAAGNIGKDKNGNIQYGAITAPGNAPWVLTVGAVDGKGNFDRRDDDVAGYSSRGPTMVDFIAKPDLVAPGTAVTSLASPNSKMYLTKPQYLTAGTRATAHLPYLTLSGTSMAAPAVAGTVALMLQANPKLTPNLVKAVLQYTAETKGNVDVMSQGAGALDARGAVTLARYFATATAGARYPKASSWSRRIIWGNSMIKGGVIAPFANAWATNVVWGENTTPGGQNIVWGETCGGNCGNKVYGNNIVWGENIVWGMDDNIVWGTTSNVVWGLDDNIVWGMDYNIVWGQNVVWGMDCSGANCANVTWGQSTGASGMNIVWGMSEGLNVVWGNNIVWGMNIVWGESTDPDASWGSSGTDAAPYSDETPEALAFDVLAWDAANNPELLGVVTTGGTTAPQTTGAVSTTPGTTGGTF